MAVARRGRGGSRVMASPLQTQCRLAKLLPRQWHELPMPLACACNDPATLSPWRHPGHGMAMRWRRHALGEAVPCHRHDLFMSRTTLEIRGALLVVGRPPSCTRQCAAALCEGPPPQLIEHQIIAMISAARRALARTKLQRAQNSRRHRRHAIVGGWSQHTAYQTAAASPAN